MLRQTKLIWLRFVNNSMALQAEDLLNDTLHMPEKISWFWLGSIHYKYCLDEAEKKLTKIILKAIFTLKLFKVLLKLIKFRKWQHSCDWKGWCMLFFTQCIIKEEANCYVQLGWSEIVMELRWVCLKIWKIWPVYAVFLWKRRLFQGLPLPRV